MISGTPGTDTAAGDEPTDLPDGEAAPERDATDDEAARAGSDGGGAGRRSTPLVAACAVLLVAALVAASLAAVYKGRLDHDRSRQRQIRNVSASMVTALMTYDFQRLDDSRNRVLSLSTGRFQKEYDAGSEPLKAVLTQTQSRSTGTVKEVFVGDSSGDSAHTIVVADQVLTGVGGTRALTGQQLSLTLVRLGNGSWKVDGLSVDVTGGGSDNGGQSGTPTPGVTPSSTPPSTAAPSSPPTTG